ncbi:MAG: Gfo/Idh/MocA family oxidoreductase [Corynebacteriales bacterium]|nr:Gfo/Idh/MocA family oxidoreductase [Mycobacteriales bacterium]
MSAMLRTALFGAGVMGSFHARVISNSSRCELAVVIDPNEETGRALAARYEATWQPNADTLPGIDAAVVAAPTEFHHKLVVPLLEDGIPTLVEKPVSGRMSEAEEMVRLAAKRHTPFMCGFVERFNPAVRTIAALLNEPMHIATVRHSPYANRIQTGVGWDLLIHDVDTCLRFAGASPVEVSEGLGRFHPKSLAGEEDIADAVMTFDTGLVASVSANRISQRKVRSLVVTELDRTIEADLIRRDVTIYRHVSSNFQQDRSYRQQTIIEIPELVTSAEPLAGQLEHFVNIIDGVHDLDVERKSILPAHHVIDRITNKGRSRSLTAV